MSSKKKNVVLSFCSHYKLEVIEPFLASWENHCRSSQLVLFVAHVGQEVVACVEALGGRVEDATKYMVSGYHPLCARFFMYRDYLAKNSIEYDRAFLTDIRDVIFQADPFDIPRIRSVYFAAEDQLIRDERVWNSRWLRELYGDAVLAEVEHNPVSCAGTTIGDIAEIQDYIRLMCLEMTTKNFDCGINYDQGIHNFIAWKCRPDYILVDIHDSIFSTVIKTAPHNIEVRDDKIFVKGRLSSVIHQWDRQDALRQHVSKSSDFKLR